MTIEELKQLDVTKLKALAYDQSVLLENTQNNLKIIQGIIASRLEEATNTSGEKPSVKVEELEEDVKE